jgi:hypothetical protein
VVLADHAPTSFKGECACYFRPLLPWRAPGASRDSGNTVESSFCQSCGSPLYKTSSGFPDFVFFHAATLDDPSQYRPQSVVWTRSRQPWDHLDPSLPAQS